MMKSEPILPSKHQQLVDSIASSNEILTLHHAYAIVGPEGSGKKWIAEAIINALIGSTKAIHPDVHICDAAKEKNNVASIREFITSFHSTPLVADKKIGCIHSVDLLSDSAQNALLKTLEEPSKHSLIFITYANQLSVLQTIRSRVVELLVPLLNKKEMLEFAATSHIPHDDAVQYMPFARGRARMLLELSESEKWEMVNESKKILVSILKDPRSIFAFTDQLSKEPEDHSRQIIRFLLPCIEAQLSRSHAHAELLIHLARSCTAILSRSTNQNPYRLIESICIRHAYH